MPSGALTGTEVAPEHGSAFRKDGDPPVSRHKPSLLVPTAETLRAARKPNEMTEQSNAETSICFKGTRQFAHPLNCIIIS